MIRDLPSTSTSSVVKELLRLRNDVGAMAMGRVLTLLVAVDEDQADAAIAAANDATRQHPARILVLVSGNRRGKGRLDAQIRVGGDAGASEIVVLRLYGELSRQQAAVVTPLLLPDSPIVAWWPGAAPADVAASPLGQMAHRRITDAAADGTPSTSLRRRATAYVAGDTDLAWTRITRWRALLASSLESAPYEPVDAATVTADEQDPSGDLLAGWLASTLGARVTRARSAAGTGLVSVRLERASGPIDLVRSEDGEDTATLDRPEVLPRRVALHTPTLAEALGEELRRLDADEIYARTLCEGLQEVRRGPSRTEAVRAGRAPAGPADVPDHPAGSDQVRGHQDGPSTHRGRVHADPEALAEAVAEELDARVRGAVQERGRAHVALTGGSMGSRVVAALAARAARDELDRAAWRKTHLWWGDERFVPSGDPERNDQQADDAGLGDLPVLRRNVHRVPARSSRTTLGEAAARYATELAAQAPVLDEADEPEQGVPVPSFDVVLLGMGPDTHVASLFPGRAELALRTAATAAVTGSPKPPPERVTLTVPAINAARSVWFVVSGADKAEAVERALAAHDDAQVPASCVRGRAETLWWCDEAAAPAG